MRPITDLDELKNIQLNIMQNIHNFCEDKSIIYYLSHGSLIGALRHKGFIPWDDDIDIFMPREEYIKFCKLFPEVQNDYGLELANVYSKRFYCRPMTKVIDTRTHLIEPNYLYDDAIGVNVDIWPIDGVPFSNSKKNKRLKKIKVLINLMYARIIRFRSCRNSLERIAHLFSIPFSAKKIVYRIDSELASVPFSSSAKVSCYVDPYKKEFDKTWFDNRSLVPFEDRLFYIPGDADKILKTLYGDYMKFPPKDKQKPHHIIKAFWKNDIEE